MASYSSPLLDDYNKTGVVSPALQTALDNTKAKLAAMQPPPPAQPQPLSNPMAGIGSPQLPGPAGPSAARERLNYLTAAPPPGMEHTKADTGASGIDQIHNTPGRVGLHILEGLGDMLLPRVTEALPGTQLHHNMLVRQAENAVGNENKEQTQDADIARTRAQIGQENATAEAENARAEATRNPVDKFASSPNGIFNTRSGEVSTPAGPKEEMEGKTITTANGIFQWNPQTRAYDTKVGDAPDKFATQHVVSSDGSVIAIKTDPKTGIVSHEVVYHGDPKVETDLTDLQVNGKPHKVIVDKRTGKIIQDLGASGEKAPVVNVGNQDFELKKTGLGLLDKAENAYRAASQSAGSLTDFVKAAQSGNKVAAEAIPLEGALNITTAQGVHRINRNEIDQVAGAGSLFDRIMGKVGKLKEGQPIPPDVRQDFADLAKVLKKGAYQTYSAAHDSATKRYKLEGEEKLPGPDQEEKTPATGWKVVGVK